MKNITDRKVRIGKLVPVIFLVLSCTGEKPPVPENVSYSQIVPETYLVYHDFPSEYVIPRDVEIWLPRRYEQLDALPVLYMFDGQMIFHPQQGWGGEFNRGWEVDEILDSLNMSGDAPEIIVVGIFNTGILRGSEYMPAKPEELLRKRIEETDHEWYKSFREHPPTSDEFLRFMVEELKPFIDARFKTKNDRGNTFVSGSSMGGLISAYAICEYPDVFGGAACLSTHWPVLDGVFVEYLKDNLPDPATHKFYFDYGTAGLDAEYEPYQKIVDSAMEARGYMQDVNWITRKYEGEDHNEKYWRARLHIPLKFLIN
jgi:enterochelin esterase-like enzyme